MNWNGEIIGNTIVQSYLEKMFSFVLLVKERSIRQKKIGDYQIKTKKEINTESIRKLSNFYFQWTKTLYQNKFKQVAFFLTIFEGYKCNKLYEITPKKRFLCEPKKTNFKSFKFHETKSHAWWFYLCFLNSCEIWNLFSLAPIRNCLWCHYR